MHAWDMTQSELNLDNVGLIISVGGDGTLHEVVNGMLRRKDQKRVPLFVLPNGSGNDTVQNYGIKDFKQALDQLEAGGDTVKVDVLKVCVD